MRAQVEAAPPRPGLAEPVDAALLRGLEKRPDLRPRSAGELAAALRSAFEEAGGGGATLASWFPRQDGAALARTIAPSAGRTAPGAPGEGPHVAPPARRPRRRIAPLVVAVVVVAALALAAAALVRGRQTASPPAPARLQVASISATVEPAGGTGHCPEADFTFRGTVTTNGAAGTIRYRWLQPDGLTSAPQSVTVAAGARQATVTLVFKFSGNGSTRGLAALHVTSPIDASSPPVDVTYSCP